MNRKKILFVIIGSILITGIITFNKNNKQNDCLQYLHKTDSLLMTKLFGNYDSELKLSIVDSTACVAGVKHSLSIPGAVFYNRHFINADSNVCILLTESPSYWSLSEYEKKYDGNNLNWLDSLQKMVLKKYELVCSDCQACGVAMGYYVFHKVGRNWELHNSYPKFARMGVWGKAPAEMQFRKIGENEHALFIENAYGGQGEVHKQLSVYCCVNESMKMIFGQQIFYSNEGAVGRPQKILSDKELSQLNEYDKEDYYRSLDFIEEKSRYKLVDRGSQFYDIDLETTILNFKEDNRSNTHHYTFSKGKYVEVLN